MDAAMTNELVPKRALTPWELGTLLEPVGRSRKEKGGSRVERPHFVPILGYIYRNRFVVASQVQRRFASVLRSDRTARRHLTEMEDLGYLALAPTRSTSPLWPKVFFVTARGAARLRRALTAKKKGGQVIRVDRQRREGYTADHVLHELLITEFLLAVWQTVEQRPDLELLKMERRSLAGHPALVTSVKGRATNLEPDAMFVHRQGGRGLMCSFAEIDTGSMCIAQLEAKFARYNAWISSSIGRQFLTDLYAKHGAADPRPTFRILLVASTRAVSEARRTEVLMQAAAAFPEVQRRVWVATGAALRQHQFDVAPLAAKLWLRRQAADVSTPKLDSLFEAAGCTEKNAPVNFSVQRSG